MKNIFYFFVLVILFNNIIKPQSGTDTIEVSTGWNIIGALSTGDIPSIITTEPPGIITSSFWGFNPSGGYYQADSLKRGKGYWVKVSQNGLIIIVLISTTNCGTVDYSGKIYNTVIIGTQCWLKENLDVGTMIPGTQEQTNNSVIEKYCYNDNPANCNIYGGLYQWYEAMQYVATPGSQGICPTGWHLPTLAEFQTVATYVNNDGNALKAVGQGSGGGAGTNTSGFSALLGGYRYLDGSFINLGILGDFWSSTEYDTSHAEFLRVWADNSVINLNFHGDKGSAPTVRCLKD